MGWGVWLLCWGCVVVLYPLPTDALSRYGRSDPELAILDARPARGGLSRYGRAGLSRYGKRSGGDDPPASLVCSPVGFGQFYRCFRR